MIQQSGEPVVSPGRGDQRRYDLAGDGWQIQITFTDITWPLALTFLSLRYQGPGGNGTVSGNAIRLLTSELGTLLTVTLQIIQAAGEETKLTLLLPDVHPTGSPEWTANIQTLAILTTSLDLTTGPSATGQTQTYQVSQLEGTLTFSTLTHPVTLSVDAVSYYIGDPIRVTLSNQSEQTIEFPDHLSECSVIQVQRQEDGNWKEVDPCLKMIPTLIHKLEAGQSLSVELISSSGSAGLYRATLRYQPSQVGVDPLAISSQEFEVRAKADEH